MNKIKVPTNFYPVIFAIIPILSLYLRNTQFVQFSDFLFLVSIPLLTLIPLWLILIKLTGSINKSALISTVFFLLFFSFGSFLEVISDLLTRVGIDIRVQLLNNIGWKLNFQLIIWIIVFVLFAIFILRLKSDLKLITTFMNVTSLVLLLLTFFKYSTNIQTVLASNRSDQPTNEISSSFAERSLAHNPLPYDELPNIYFIILDGYGRSDTLHDFYKYDNDGFEDFLERKGFYLADRSRSNYLHTSLSIASNLNYSYLQDYAEQMKTIPEGDAQIINLIQNNRVMGFLATQGYKIISFESGYFATELNHIDSYYSNTWTFSQFTNSVINLTPLQIWLDKFQYDNHRNRIHYTFSKIPDVDEQNQPVFVFAHIIAPHPPFVFGANGEPLDREKVFTLNENLMVEITNEIEYATKYPDQINYINSLVMKMIEQIRAKSDRGSIIVIQGDHGPRLRLDGNNLENTKLEEVFPIFNAIYFFDQDYSSLSNDITSVNTFRVIFDQYFGTDLGLLENRSFYSKISTPYQFVDVTDSFPDR